jgi:hypothetical protein
MNGLVIGEFVRNEYTNPGRNKRPVHRITCHCGKVFECRVYHVTSGKTRSCGCLSGEARTKHGAARGGTLTPEYRAWRCMLTRAKNPNIANAHHYSGRGIGVAPEWDSGGDQQGFPRFLAHVGPKPTPDLSLDRIDNDRGYEPGNVRWADATRQTRNTRKNRRLTFAGETLCVADWAERAGIPEPTLRDRIFRLGWPVERALTEPLRPDRRRVTA